MHHAKMPAGHLVIIIITIIIIIIEIQHEVFASRADSEKNPSSRWDSNPRPSVI